MKKIDKSKYVVLDVETNGLSSISCDLLSISIYSPDNQKVYNRFLPLELNDCVLTTGINGITEEMLLNKPAMNQEEFNELIKDFDLENRAILHYGAIDEKFIKNYLKRKRIKGFEKLTFYNIKHNIISSKFSEGNITKDNLCELYSIENVTKVHSGINDCFLEWKLFEKMNDNKLLVTGNDVYEFNEDYIIPASFLQNYPNFKYQIKNYPYIYYNLEELESFIVDSNLVEKFSTNISGITIEHLINSMLHVDDKSHENFEFLVNNKNKLKKIGSLKSNRKIIYIIKNDDGTISAQNKKDEKEVEQINRVTNIIKEQIEPLIDYIKINIFNNKKIMSQELVINYEDNVLAMCDLSTDDKILEIKTSNVDVDKIRYQLFYESKGREIFLLKTNWIFSSKNRLKFVIYRAIPVCNKKCISRKNNDKLRQQLEYKIRNKNVEIIEYTNQHSNIKLRCKLCCNEWISSYEKLIEKPYCPNCIEVMRPTNYEERLIATAEKGKKGLLKYQNELKYNSNGNLIAINYHGEKEKLTVFCNKCGSYWKAKANNLLENPECPKCKSNK